MEVVKNNQLLPGDPRLIDHIVSELKSQGIFDQFRKECIADVDTKPAYQNLRQRVEGNVANFLNLQKWKPDMNKNQLREMLRKNIQESGYLDTGVERIVDQVVNPKISTIFFPQVEDVVYKFLGIEKPEKSTSSTNSANGLSVNTSVDLLPTDLDPISPASDKSHNKSTDTVEATKFDDNNDNEDNDKLDDCLKEDDESPPFEPIEDTSGFLVQDESSVDSHLSGISGLTSHESNSNHSSPKNMATLIADVSNNDNNDSDLSKVSSDSRLSVVTSDGKSSPDDKMVICDDNSNSKNSQINNVNQDSHSSSEHSLRIDLEQNSNDEVDNRNEIKEENVNIKQESIQDISENAVNGSDIEKSNEKQHENEVPAEKDNNVEQADIRENSVEKVNSIDSEKNDETQTNVSKSRRRSRHSENKDRRSDRDRKSDKDRRDRHDNGSRDKYKESKTKEKLEKEKNYSKEYLKELSTDSSESTAQDKNKEEKLKERSEKSRDDKSKDERSKDRTDKIKDEKSKDKEKSKHSRDSDSKSRDDKHKSRSSSKHGSSKSSSRRGDRRDSSKDYHESRDKSKYSSKDSKSSSKIDKDDGKRDSSRDSKHSESKSKLKETKHSKDSKDKDLKDSKDGKENKDKEKDSKETDSKHKGRNRTKSEGSSQNSHHKSSSSHDRKDKDKKKDADLKKNSKDDHFSSKDKTSDSRRSTDRDSNDGSSGTSNKNSSSGTNSQSQSKRSQGNSRNSDNTSSGSNSRDSGQSDKMLAMQVVDIFQAKLDEANNIMYKKLKSPSKAVTLDLSDSEFTISPASNIIQNKIMQNKRQLSLDDSSDNSEQKSPKIQKVTNEQTNEETITTNEIKEENNENIPVENDTEEIETDIDSLQNNIQNQLSSNMLQSKIRKPKFASNIFEARKLMKIRKKMEKIERRRQLRLNLINFQSLNNTKTADEVEKENVVTTCEIIEPSCSSNVNSSKERPKSEEKKNNKIDVNSICLKDAKIILTKLDFDANMKKHIQEDDKKIELDSMQTEEETPKKILSEANTEDDNESVVPKSSVISKESWDAIEEKLQSKEIMIDYSSYDYETENDNSLVRTNPGPDIVYSDDDDDCLYLSNIKPEVERYLERMATLQKGGLTIGNILDDVPKTENTESPSLEKTIVVNRRLRKPNLKYSTNFTADPVPTIEKKSTEQNNKKVDNKKKQTRAANKRKISEVLSLDNNDIENENNNVTSAQRITDVNETEDEKKENAPEISLTSKLNIKPIRSGKRGKKNEFITPSNTNEAFVLPPSPESDVSASSGELKINNTKLRVREHVTASVPKAKANKSSKLAAQRYSSDDLYKPRPMFGGTRRSRASLNNSVSDADLITPSKRRK